MDPADPRLPTHRGGGMTLSHVQMWVMSVLAVSTGLHFALALIAAALWLDDLQPNGKIVLLVLAGIMGVASLMIGAAIHRTSVFRWWVHLGWLPGIAGLCYLLWG